MVEITLQSTLSPFSRMVAASGGQAITFEVDSATAAALMKSEAKRAEQGAPHPLPSQMATALSRSGVCDRRLGRMDTFGLPVMGLPGWASPPALVLVPKVYDLMAPLRDMQQRIREHTIEQARLDELGRLKARGNFESAAPTPASLSLAKGEAQHLPHGSTPPAESPVVRQDRRLARLRALGGNMVRHGDGWATDRANGRRGALAKLIQEEAQYGRPMSDKTNVRDDLAAAAEREASRR